jgi:hypothetical protein
VCAIEPNESWLLGLSGAVSTSLNGTRSVTQSFQDLEIEPGFLNGMQEFYQGKTIER